MSGLTLMLPPVPQCCTLELLADEHTAVLQQIKIKSHTEITLSFSTHH